jgi:methionyl-tRNA formyltransferase
VAKLVLFGQAQFGARVLDGLLAAGHEITAVCLPPDRDGRPVDPLAEAARAAGLRIVQRKSYKGDDAFAEVNPAVADLAVLAYVTQIIPLAMLDAPRLASLCFHPSLLPAYRGGSAIPWQIINGETLGGITLFRPDDGIDAGPIYLQRQIEIGPNDSAGSYYYRAVFEPGIEATLDTVQLVLDGAVEGIAQDEKVATYDPLCRDEHANIDWARPVQQVHNLIRGCDPSPGAYAMSEGRRVRLYGSRIENSDGASANAGTVVAIGGGGMEIATADGSISVAKLAIGSGKKPAEEAAHEAGIAVGDSLVR